MTEGRLIGSQRDPHRLTVIVKVFNLLRRKGIKSLPYYLMPPIGKCMLSIELQVVDLPTGELLHNFVNLLQSRHPVARNVEHDTPHWKGRSILDRAFGQTIPVKVEQLSKCGYGVSQTCNLRSFHFDLGTSTCIMSNFEVIGFAAKTRDLYESEAT